MGRAVGFTGVVVAAALITGGVGGCGTDYLPAGSADPVEVDGGRQVTVPVPWADPAAGTGGIEPATVWVGDSLATDFSIDLTDLQAEGAGAAWTAASATAAAVGSLYSGLDPREVDVWFSVSGPIDGPSAGALLTTAILAALRDVPLLPGITMTGTVSPDGTISEVGGVGIKLRAVADAGYSTLLLPAGNTTLSVSGSGEPISAVDAGRELGVDVRHVATIAQAYEELTGQELVAEADTPYVLPPVVRAAGARTAEELTAEASALAGDLPAGTSERSVVEADLRAAREALAVGDAPAAYARAAEALLVAGGAVMRAAYADVAAREGLAAARQRMADEVAVAIAEAEAAIADGSSVSGLGLEQSVTLPTALTWSAYSHAALMALAAAVPELRDEDELAAAASVLAEERLSVQYLQPDALEVVRAMPSRPLPSQEWLAGLLSGYTNFLTRGARANADYITDVVLPAVPGADAGLDDVRSLAPILAQLGLQTGRMDPTPEDASAEVRQAAVAITDFVASTAFISATQGFGVEGFNMVSQAPTVTDEAALLATFGTSREIVADIASLMAEQGLDAGYPVWSAEWGADAFGDPTGDARQAAGAVLAFNELWYDAVALQMAWTAAGAVDDLSSD